MRHSLDQIGLGARGDGLANILVTLIRGEYNHRAVRPFRPDGRNRLNTAHIRHSQIHQNHIRRVLARQRNCLSPSSGLPDDHHVRLRTEDAQESDTHYRVIVGDQNPNDAGIGTFSNRGSGMRGVA